MRLWAPSRQASPPPIPVIRPEPKLPAHPFHGWTESLYVSGLVRGAERLSDLFNRREPLVVEEAKVVPVGSSSSAMIFPQEPLFDPFDFDIVLGRAEEPRLGWERGSRRIYKVQYPVLLEGDDFEVRGVVHLFPGNAPEFAMHHTNVLFMPVTNPVVRRSRRLASDPKTDVALVNRYAIKAIRQLDSLN